MHKMVNRLCADNTLCPLSGFDQYALENFTRVVFEVPMKPEFVIGEGNSSTVRNATAKNIICTQHNYVFQILTELTHLHRALYTNFRDRFVTYLFTIYFPNIGCPVNVSEEYTKAISQLDEKQFRKFFQVQSDILVPI
jgi:hypothetical protein